MTPSPLRVAAAAAADDGRTETPKEDEDNFLDDDDDLVDRATEGAPRYLANVPLRGLPPGSKRAGARRRRDMPMEERRGAEKE